MRAEWGHTSSMMALIANCNRDAKKQSKPYTPSDFDPFATKTQDKTSISMEQAMKLFPGR